MKKLVQLLFSRMATVALLIILQLLWIVFMVTQLGDHVQELQGILSLFSLIVVIYIVNKPDNPAFKLAWIIPILLVPVFGGLFYLLFTLKGGTRRMSKALDRELALTDEALEPYKYQDEGLKTLDPAAAGRSHYLSEWAASPTYAGAPSRYYPLGDLMFPDMLRDMREAREYIFLEYFVIDQGSVWDEVLAVLRQKVSEGVDVRVIYDDFGSMGLLPASYPKKLAKMGIKAYVFNPAVPFIAGIMNHRDHRKITVVDGRVCYVGGLNLADEYVNRIERFGHWKDGGARLEGEAVYSVTLTFLSFWNSLHRTSCDYSRYMPPYVGPRVEGYVTPYCDSPLDGEGVGESVYLDIVNSARRYFYIYSPYLILDNEIITAFTLAAKRGVDVRVVTPAVPDKRMVFWLTQSYYGQLISGGVRVFEYVPGFLHSKCCVSDDTVATVGSVNLDYRSLYLHFENGAMFCRHPVVGQLLADFEKTFDLCREITPADTQKPLPVRVVQGILRGFAPLF